MDIKVDGVEFHRNGIRGVGFHVIRFHTGRRPNRQDLVGIVFSNADDPDNPAALDGYVAVIDPAAPSEKFRGDNFERELRAAARGGLR